MAGLDDKATAALAVLRQWQWQRGDPDGNTWPIWLRLREAVNRLAMEGIARPQSALIGLLCQGELIADGDYRWQKYQGGNHFELSEHDTRIKQRQWQVLADLIEQEHLELVSPGGFLLDHVELTKLGMESCYPYEYNFSDDRFNTSLCPPDTDFHDPTYFEEWFSAWDISISPSRLDFDEMDVEPESPVVSKGGRRPANWWPDFAEELAVYLHENGLPAGQGHEGQSTMIDAIFGRMAGQGKSEPGRGTVQPVVNAVLRRLRSAGN